MAKRWIHSASQIETFRSCQRKWGYRYIDRICSPPSKAAQFGTFIHAELEKLLTGHATDITLPAWKVIEPGLQFLPSNLEKHQVEKPFAFVEDEMIFRGFIDFHYDLGDGAWLIGDHKTCSSLASAHSSTSLKQDVQANVYARWAFNNLSANKVKLRWIYYQTKPKNQARCVEAELDSEENQDICRQIFTSAKEIEAIVDTEREACSLPKNTGSCFKYGPCPYYARCKSDSRTSAKNNLLTRLPKENDVAMSSAVNNPSFHLYVDCVPIKSAGYERTLELSDLLKPIFDQIKTEKELSHYRLAGYGQHVGLIANFLSEHLKNKTYDHRTAILSSVKTPEGCDTLQTLMAAASQITRGF